MKDKIDYQSKNLEDYVTIKLTSMSFQQNGFIPERYTCDGININPSLFIENIPEETKSLAIIVDDPDAPKGNFCHWLVWNLPVTHQIKEK